MPHLRPNNFFSYRFKDCEIRSSESKFHSIDQVITILPFSQIAVHYKAGSNENVKYLFWVRDFKSPNVLLYSNFITHPSNHQNTNILIG